MDLNRIKFLSIFSIFVFCFFAHFLYTFFPSFLTSIFFPVNESVWEHMKMLVTSIIIWEFILYLILRKENYYFYNYILSVLCISLCSVLSFLIMYFSLYFFFGDNFIINIILLFLSICFSVNLGFDILNKQNYNLELFSLVCLFLMFIIFAIFTYNPPKYPLFVDPRDGSYGLLLTK